MNKKDVCPCCGHALPPYRVRIAYGGLPECPHCGSDCGLPPRQLIDPDEGEPNSKAFAVALVVWVIGVIVVAIVFWRGP